MGDLGYVNDRLSFLMITPFKKPQNGELTANQERYNKIFNQKRVEIEQFFGLLKLKFPIFRCGYRGPLKHLTTLFRLGIVFVNKTLDRNCFTDEHLRDAYLLEQREKREYEDRPLEKINENWPELQQRERVGRIVVQRTLQQEEDEMWEAAAHRRTDPHGFERNRE
jgi:hypothetical protein